jgi:signal transduction histidine kinase
VPTGECSGGCLAVAGEAGTLDGAAAVTDNYGVPKADARTLDELRREVAELRASCARIVTAADNQRRSIERELHDGAMQDLAAFAVNLQLASRLVATDPPGAGDLLDEMLESVHESLDEVRQLAWSTYPSLLLERGLGDALRAAASAAGTPTRVKADVGRYSPETETSIYFCCTELLQGLAEGGHHATVRVQRERGKALFDVTVDGGDFEQWAARDLSSLSDRLGAFGGWLEVAPAPAPERGVRISGGIPLQPDDQALVAESSPASAR